MRLTGHIMPMKWALLKRYQNTALGQGVQAAECGAYEASGLCELTEKIYFLLHSLPQNLQI